jgi:hypothetical protein
MLGPGVTPVPAGFERLGRFALRQLSHPDNPIAVSDTGMSSLATICCADGAACRRTATKTVVEKTTSL